MLINCLYHFDHQLLQTAHEHDEECGKQIRSPSATGSMSRSRQTEVPFLKWNSRLRKGDVWEIFVSLIQL